MKKLLLVLPVVLTLSLAAAVPAYASTVQFAPAVNYATGNNPYYVTAGDVNGDATLDLLTADFSDDTVTVLLGAGDGTFSPTTPVSTLDQPQALAIGDYNADTRNDIAVTTNGNTTSIYLGNGDGTFTFQTSIAVGGASFPTAADLDNDGILDLAVTDGGGSAAVSILIGNGDGTFQTPVRYPTGPATRDAHPVDLNNDTVLDLVVPSSAGNSFGVLLGNGDGTFGARTDVAAGSHPFWSDAADINADSNADLVISNAFGNSVSVFLGNGDGTFAPRVDYAAGSLPDTVELVDLTGDGQLDLAVANDTSATVSVLVGNGDGTFQAQEQFAVGARSFGLASGDFSSDGQADIAASNYNAASVSVLINQTVAAPTLTSLSAAQVWVGLKNSDSVGVKFDLMAQAYVNGNFVSSGQVNTFPGGSSGFNNANLATIEFDSFAPVPFPSGSVISLTLYVRNACVASGHNSGVARLWYDDAAANSRLGATIAASTTTYYLRNGFTLETAAGPGPKKTIDVQSGAKCSAFKPFGTWTSGP